ncbi:MAG: MFS transporter [Nevskia sp.]|nr:MFS transporter [Nevskia sp.]
MDMYSPAPVLAGRSRSRILAILCLSVLLAQIDTSVVNLAVHDIGVDLHASLRALQWVIDGYNLSYAVLLMSGGTLADLIGRRRVLLAGALAFTAGSAVCALAPGAAALIAGRVLTGLGAALMLPASLALIRVIWTDAQERAHVIGVWAGINGAAFAIGPSLGGGLIQAAGWRCIFLLTLPVGLAVVALGPRTIPESSDPQGRRIDLAGQALAALALGGAVLGMIEREVVPGLVAVCTFGAFAAIERRLGAAAMVPMELLANGKLACALGVAAAMTFGMYGLIFLLPLTWLRGGVFDVAHCGLALLPMSLVFAGLSHRSGRWSARFGAARTMAAGMALIGCGLATMAATHGGRPLWLAESGLLLTGIGMACNTGPVLAAAVAAVSAARAGTASALVNTARMVGASLGVAVAGAVYGLAADAATGLRLAMACGAAAVFAGSALAAAAPR